MLEILDKGGPVLWLIIALSFVAVFIIIERYLYFRKINVDENRLFLRVRQAVEQGFYNEALSICDNSLSPMSALIKTGIEYRRYPEQAQKEILKDTASQEIPRLERYLTFLGSITHIAPLLGLLGTVTGIMRSFNVLGQFGSVSDPSVLAKGISEALITTVAGIVVAVPCVVFYNQLVNRVNLILLRMENQVNELILMLNSAQARSAQARPAPHRHPATPPAPQAGAAPRMPPAPRAQDPRTGPPPRNPGAQPPREPGPGSPS